MCRSEACCAPGTLKRRREMPPRLCIVEGPDCSDGGNAVPGTSRCRAHTNSNWGRYKPKHADVYKTGIWQRLRARVLREEPVCAEEGCQERSTSVDHVVSLADGGAPYDRANLRGMCYPHHKRRSSKQGAEARRRRT
jgi:5-methylcytosine-specific restriction endonuclease McrA